MKRYLLVFFLNLVFLNLHSQSEEGSEYKHGLGLSYGMFDITRGYGQSGINLNYHGKIEWFQPSLHVGSNFTTYSKGESLSNFVIVRSTFTNVGLSLGFDVIPNTKHDLVLNCHGHRYFWTRHRYYTKNLSSGEENNRVCSFNCKAEVIPNSSEWIFGIIYQWRLGTGISYSFEVNKFFIPYIQFDLSYMRAQDYTPSGGFFQNYNAIAFTPSIGFQFFFKAKDSDN